VTTDKPSKNARKREQNALQDLGEYLISRKNSDLGSIGLSEDLLSAVRAAAKMKSHGALRRQKQLVGKLMQPADADLILAWREHAGARERAEKQLFARAEKWRDRLLRDSPAELAKFEARSGVEDAELRQLLKNLAVANNDRVEKTLKRQVFRRIHDILVRIGR